MNKAAIIYIIVIVLILILVAYYYMSKGSSSSSSSPSSSSSVPQAAISSTPPSAAAVAAAASAPSQTGIYYYAPSPPNVTYAQAQSIASGLGVSIASPAQLVAGGAKGINLCSYGWLNNGQPGLFLQTAQANCGPQGLSYNVATTAYGIWLYGVIPPSVLASGSPSYAIV